MGQSHEKRWWDDMQSVKDEMNSAAFVRWLAGKVKRLGARRKVIGLLAWNDRNSDWNLEYNLIVRTGRFSDGERATAEAVAQSVVNMLD
jgi:hypothetical protein